MKSTAQINPVAHSEVAPAVFAAERDLHVLVVRRPFDRAKRVIDVLVSLALLILLAPVITATAVLVRLTSPGPAIFRQKRLTAGGRAFTMYKFRSMRQDAEAHTGAVWASAGDPRVTPIGRFIRQTRIDELPQLVNVLRGDMSLIGPRPERPEIATQLQQEIPNFSRRLEVRAGITGLAQVSAGYAGTMRSYRKKVLLDVLYVEKRSFLLDLRIALKTVLVIVTGAGAR